MRFSSFFRHRQGACHCAVRIVCLTGLAWLAFSPLAAGAREDMRGGAAAPLEKILVSSEKVIPKPPQKSTAKHSRKVEDEPQGIALSAPAPAPGHADKAHPDKTEAHDEAQLASSSDSDDKQASAPRVKKDRPAKISKRAQRRVVRRVETTASVKNEKSSEKLREAEASMAAGDYAAAADLYAARLKEDSTDGAAFRGRAQALLKQGTPEALTALQGMVDLKAPNGAALAALAQAKTSAGQQAEAMDLMWKALAVEPDNDQYRLTLAILFDRAGQKDMALSLYRQLRHGVPEAIQKRIQYLEK